MISLFIYLIILILIFDLRKMFHVICKVPPWTKHFSIPSNKQKQKVITSYVCYRGLKFVELSILPTPVFMIDLEN